MVGKKGKSGRKRKWHNNPVADRIRKASLRYHYEHHEEHLKQMREYHKKNKHIMIYAKKHGISIPEARKILAKQRKEKET